MKPTNSNSHHKQLTPEQVRWLDACTQPTTEESRGWEFNSNTGEVNVYENFVCAGQGLHNFMGIRFGKIGMNFVCNNNQLTSLEGAPQRVGRTFNCSDNRLTSLAGSPRKVTGAFICDNNQLTSLEGAPDFIGRSLYCNNNKLTSLEGLPPMCGAIFDCSRNPVALGVLLSIFIRMNSDGNSYLQAAETLWNEIPVDDQALLYRPEFDWVSAEERRKLELVKAYWGFKDMI